MNDLNKLLKTKVKKMSEQELYHALFTDYLTGVLNRRAFEQAQFRFVAVVDMDSLKWLNDNLGHRAGDTHLTALAHTLAGELGPNRVFRIAGDEFAVIGRSRIELRENLQHARLTFPGFSYGIGETLQLADKALKRNKQARALDGTRAARGEEPPWLPEYGGTGL